MSFKEANPAGLLWHDQKSFSATEQLPRDVVLPPLGRSRFHADAGANENRIKNPEIKKRFISIVVCWFGKSIKIIDGFEIKCIFVVC